MTGTSEARSTKAFRLRTPHFSVRNRQLGVIAVSVLLAQSADISFVGHAFFDAVWAAVVVGTCSYLATTAKRSMLVTAAVAATVTSSTLLAVGLGVIAVVAGSLSMVKLHRRAVFARGVCGAAAITGVLVSAENRVSWAIGLSAVLVAAPIAASGLRNAPKRTRRIARWVTIGAVLYVAVAGTLAAVAVYDQIDKVDLATAELDFGLAAARAGETALAEQHLQAATALAGNAGRSIARFGLPGRIVPLLGQHVDALAGVLDRAELVSDQASVTVGIADDEALGVVNGRIDPAAVASLANPLGHLAQALGQLEDELLESADAPLIGPVADRVEELLAPVTKAHDDAEVGAAAARVMPDVLGGNGTKRYLLLFTSPAEARGRFGFPGSFAEVTLTDGRLLTGEQGATSEVFARQDVDQAVFDLTTDDIDRYRGYGPTATMLNATIPPNFRAVAEIVAEQWRQSGRAPLDGVVRLDPASLAAVLQWTGPVSVASVPTPITAANLEQFLLFDQYVQFQSSNAPRREVLDLVADTTVQRLVTAELPSPRVLADVFGPLAEANHFDAAIFDDDAQDLLRQAGAAGEFEAPAGDGLVLSTINSSGNKIDTFLDTAVDYEATVEGDQLDGTITVTLTNEAPASGLPRYVVGSSVTPPLPSGTNRLTLLLWTRVEPVAVSVDGAGSSLRAGIAGGDRWLTEVPVDIGPGGSATIVVQVSGPVPFGPEGYELHLEPGGTVRPTAYRISVGGDDGLDVNYEQRVRSPRTVR